MTHGIYAIGLDGYVEIRRSKKAPKVVRSVMSKNVPEKAGFKWVKCERTDPRAEAWNTWWHDWDEPGPPPPFVKREDIWRDRVETVKIVTVKGGRRLGLPIKARLFTRWTGHTLGFGVVWPLPEKMGKEIVRRSKGQTGRD